MGRQAYMTRLALGRSPYEPLQQRDSQNDDEGLRGQDTQYPDNFLESTTASSTSSEFSGYQQKYDSSGYPENLESKALSRQYRRAHNDVLETVGVCVGVHSDGQPIKTQLDNQRKPTLDRSEIDAVAYRFYSGTPLTRILKAEWRHFGMMKFLFAGTPAALTDLVLEMASFWAIEELSQIVAGGLWRRFRGEKMPKTVRPLFITSHRLLQLLTFALLAPVEIFATLQRLDLLPAWPPLPHLSAFVPFTLSSPIQMPSLTDHLSIKSFANFLASLAVSPLVLWWIICRTRLPVSQKLYAYIRAALPKPSNPDKYSLQAAKEGNLDEDSVPGLYPEPLNRRSNNSHPESSSVVEELARDLQHIGKTFQQLYDRWTWTKSPLECNDTRQNWNMSANETSAPDLEIFTRDAPSQEQLADTVPPTPSNEVNLNPIPPSTSPDTFSHPPSRSMTPNPSVEITTTTASTGTVHMNVQIPAPNQSSEPLFNTNFSNSPPTSDDGHNVRFVVREPHHRITALTAYAADSMASHLSSTITDLLFLPLEALFVRSVALAFLSSPARSAGAQVAAARWKSEIFPLGGWFGMGLRSGWRGVGDYVGKMVLVTGMEFGVGMAVWQACTGVSRWCGRKWFRWGRL